MQAFSQWTLIDIVFDIDGGLQKCCIGNVMVKCIPRVENNHIQIQISTLCHGFFKYAFYLKPVRTNSLSYEG